MHPYMSKHAKVMAFHDPIRLSSLVIKVNYTMHYVKEIDVKHTGLHLDDMYKCQNACSDSRGTHAKVIK